MVEWLSNYNRQEEGESDINKYILKIEDDGNIRQVKVKLGILDRATTNIQQKQVWPQQNLGEDWADEDIEFKQLKYEHLVAGESRTIETCTDPAEILGRLKTTQEDSLPQAKRIRVALPPENVCSHPHIHRN